MKISFVSATPQSGMIIVPVIQDGLAASAIAALDSALDGAIGKAAKAGNFTGKSGQSLTLPAPGTWDQAVVVLLGLGKADALKSPDVMGLGGKAFNATKGFSSAAILLGDLKIANTDGADLADAVALGARLRSYAFTLYKKKTAAKDQVNLEGFTVITDDEAAAQKAYTISAAIAEGVELARDLVSEPPNVLHPESFAERCQNLEALGVVVDVLDDDAMEALGMGSLLGVGLGSERGSRLVSMRWDGGKAGEAPVAFIGKGVTFDTGGISLKPGAGMEDMKFDMGGAAAVTGAMHALAARKAKANVVGLIGLVENMPDGKAQRPSDVVTSMSGQTIEVINTDAEGRLVLADVLTYAQKTFSPKAMVDLATLTGAILVSLAHEYGGLFTQDEDVAAKLLTSADNSGEPLWRMPLTKAHDEMIKSDIADMKNIGPRWAGSSTAAAFLARYVEDGTPWAHLDIAGMAWTDKNLAVCAKGATGYGVRLLDSFIRDHFEG